MKTKLIVILCIFVLPQISQATEYIFQLNTGYAVRVITRAQLSFLDAINSGENVFITIISNTPQQVQTDQEAGVELMYDLLPQAFALFQQYLNGENVYSQTVTFQPDFFTPVASNQPTEASSHHAQLGATCNEFVQAPSWSLASAQTHNQIAPKFPCSFPDCSSVLGTSLTRGKHHKTHLTPEFLSSLNGRGEDKVEVACPICKRTLVGSLVAVMAHISKAHKKQ